MQSTASTVAHPSAPVAAVVHPRATRRPTPAPRDESINERDALPYNHALSARCCAGSVVVQRPAAGATILERPDRRSLVASLDQGRHHLRGDDGRCRKLFFG